MVCTRKAAEAFVESAKAGGVARAVPTPSVINYGVGGFFARTDVPRDGQKIEVASSTRGHGQEAVKDLHISMHKNRKREDDEVDEPSM